MSSIQQRYHAFDALRAVMMLLGLVIHGIISYTTYTKGFFSNFYKDPMTSRIGDALLFWIHIYRMPVFFVMAGFFALLVYEKKGKREFISSRMKRIFLPLVFGWFILFPLINIAAGFTRQVSTAGVAEALRLGWEKMLLAPWGLSPIHLWFLYFLVIFYLLMLPLLKLPDALKETVNDVFRKLVLRRERAILFSVPTIALLLMMQTGTFDTPKRFIPVNLAVLFSYFYFFVFGWLLYKNRDLLNSLKRDAWPQFVLSLLFFAVHFYYVDMMQDFEKVTVGRGLVASACGGAACWLSLFAFSGLALRYFDKPNPVISYMSESSYFIFLAHLPLVIIATGLLSPLPWPGLLKCLIVIVTTYTLLLICYHYLVRNKFLGRALNGRKANIKSLSHAEN
jgi:glucans biosynthesis protein C